MVERRNNGIIEVEDARFYSGCAAVSVKLIDAEVNFRKIPVHK